MGDDRISYGKELPTSGFALLPDNLCFAYRVQDTAAGYTFYVIGLGGHFRTYGLYFPENDFLIARDAATLASALHYESRYKLHFLRHAVQFGQAILAGSEIPAGTIYHSFRGHPAIHLGHFIWQDLSGIHHLLAGIHPNRIPYFMVPETHLRPEIYGPIERIFPALTGKVIPTNDTFSARTCSFYKENARVIKATSLYVPRAVGASVIAGYKNSDACRELLVRCAAAREDSTRIVVVGLRIGNRTIVDMKSFALRTITAICKAFPGTTVVLDGQNTSPDAHYDSFGDNSAAPDSFLRQEIAIGEALTRHAKRHGHKLINLIGRPVMESLL